MSFSGDSGRHGGSGDSGRHGWTLKEPQTAAGISPRTAALISSPIVGSTSGGAPENQGVFGFGNAVRAVGAVCGGSRRKVKKDGINVLEEILHIPLQPPTSLPQTPQRVLSFRHPSVKSWSVLLSRLVEERRKQESQLISRMTFNNKM